MTKQELLNAMERLHACKEATEYVTNHPSDDAQTIWQECERGDWMCWLIDRCEAVFPETFAFACADRAVRIHAANSLDNAGLAEHAAKLRALAPVVDTATARLAKDAANAADAAAYYAADAADAADAAYYAANAADAAADDAAHAAYYAAADAADAYYAEREEQANALRHMSITIIIG